MLIIGIDPGISGSICFFQDGKIIDVVEMPTMTEGKKNKKQVNGSQICLLYTSPSPRDSWASRMPSSAWKKHIDPEIPGSIPIISINYY